MHPTPSFYCDFTKNPQPITAGILIAYAGGTGGSRVNQLGLIETGVGSPRTDFDPSSTRAVNNHSQSEQLASWDTPGFITTVTNATIAPDGNKTADKLVEDGTTNIHRTAHGLGGASSWNPTPAVASVYLKAAERRFASVYISGSGVRATIRVDLLTGVITSEVFSTLVKTISGTVYAGDGWWRCYVGFSGPISNSTLNVSTELDGVIDANQADSYAGDGVSGIYVWGAQHESGLSLSKYTPTSGAVAPSLPTCLGLLIEEARTNTCLQSADFTTTWTNLASTETADAMIAPDGSVAADVVIEDSANSEHGMVQGITLVNATVYTFSVFVKQRESIRSRMALYESSTTGAQATFDLGTGTVVGVAGAGTPVGKITAYPAGWYRVSMTFTAGASAVQNLNTRILRTADTGVTAYLGDGVSGHYLWGAQMEVGPGPSSYIPTTVASATRLGETQNIPAGQIGAWFNQNEGTWVARFVRRWVNSQNGRLVGYNNGATTPLSFSGGIESYDGTSPTDTINQITDGKLSIGAGAYRKTTDISVCLDGGGIVNSVNANFPTVTQIDIGGRVTEAMQGHLQTLAYYPRRLSDQTIKTLTTPTQ